MVYKIKIKKLHEDYDDNFIKLLKTKLIIPNIKLNKLNKPLSPENPNNVFRFLKQSPLDIYGIIVGLDPYPNSPEELPFQDDDFQKQSNKNVAQKISNFHSIPFELVNGCDLSKVPNVFLINAAFTVIKPHDKKRFTKIHVDLWSDIFCFILSYIFQKSNVKWMITFGHDETISKNIKQVIDSLGITECSIISSPHPAAPNFINSDNDIFMMLYSMTCLRNLPKIKWYKALVTEYPIKIKYPNPDIESAGLYQKLLTIEQKFRILDPIPLESLSSLLGGGTHALNSVINDNKEILEEIYRSYHTDLKAFSKKDLLNRKELTTKGKLITFIKDKQFAKKTCYCGYYLTRNELWLWLFDANLKCLCFKIDFLHSMFYKKFKDSTYGYFDEELYTDQDKIIPLTSYECVIDIINSKEYKYFHSELGLHLLEHSHQFTFTDKKNMVYLKNVIHNIYIPYKEKEKTYLSSCMFQEITTPSGFNYLQLPIINVSITGNYPSSFLVTNRIVLRDFTNYINYKHEQNNINSRFSICLLITKSYIKCIELYLSDTKIDDICNMWKDSLFELAVAKMSTFSCEEIDKLLVDLKYESGVFTSKSVKKKYSELLELDYDKLTKVNKIEFMKYKSAIKVLYYLNKFHNQRYNI